MLWWVYNPICKEWTFSHPVIAECLKHMMEIQPKEFEGWKILSVSAKVVFPESNYV